MIGGSPTPAKHKTIYGSWTKTDCVVLTAWYATLVTILVILAGGVVSLYADDVKNAWPIQWHARGPISWPAFWSWALAILAALAFFVRAAADRRANESAQSRLIQQAQNLELLMRTMPPVNFLDAFAIAFQDIDDVVNGALGIPPPPFNVKTVQEAIRITLRTIAVLAKIYDGDRPQVRYAANVMIFRESDGLSDKELGEISSRLKFCETGVNAKGLRGVLDLDPKLSASTDEMSSVPDPLLMPFALGIPKEPKKNNKYMLLPGAPLAFVENKADIHEDFGRLRKWCDENADLTDFVKNAMDDYFASQKEHMQSFLSIPLVHANSPKAPFGILNIHSRQVGLLRDHPEAVAQFVATVKPLRIHLAKLMRGLELSVPQPAVAEVLDGKPH